MKIVINDCYGGFNLSDEAFELYLNKIKIKYYAYGSKYSSIMGKEYYKVPKEKYQKLSEQWFVEDGDYRRINGKHWYLSARDIKRHDPVLLEVINELGDKVNTKTSELKVVEIPDTVDYTIEEYDGLEHIAEKHRTWS